MLDTLLDTLTSAIVRRKRLNCLGFSVVRGAMLDTFSLSLSLRFGKRVGGLRALGVVAPDGLGQNEQGLILRPQRRHDPSVEGGMEADDPPSPEWVVSRRAEGRPLRLSPQLFQGSMIAFQS